MSERQVITSTVAALFAYAKTLPIGAAPIPVLPEVLRDLAEIIEARGRGAPDSDYLLTTRDLGNHFRCSRSTARSWLPELCPEAYRLPRLGWRIPRSALPALEQRLRKDPDVNLGAWRRSKAA